MNTSSATSTTLAPTSQRRSALATTTSVVRHDGRPGHSGHDPDTERRDVPMTALLEPGHTAQPKPRRRDRGDDSICWDKTHGYYLGTISPVAQCSHMPPDQQLDSPHVARHCPLSPVACPPLASPQSCDLELLVTKSAISFSVPPSTVTNRFGHPARTHRRYRRPSQRHRRSSTPGGPTPIIRSRPQSLAP